jgi:hypothetical protein
VARASIPDGAATAACFEESPVSMIVAAAPQEATGIAESLLAPILALPAADRDMLLGTVDAWVANAVSAKHTTGQVYCHPLSVTSSRRIAKADGSADADVSKRCARLVMVLSRVAVARISCCGDCR